MNWKHLPAALLALSVGLTGYGLWALFFPSTYNAFFGEQALAIRVIVIGMIGIAFVAWLKR